MNYKTSALAEFCKTGSGGTPSRKEPAYYDGGTIPWVKSGELRENIIFDTEEHVTDLAVKKTSVKLAPKGAILLAMYGATVGRMAILGIDATTNQAICHIIPDEKIANRDYLYHCLQHKVPELLSKAIGGAQPNISQQIIKRMQIPLPPLPEQQRIAAILDKADALRAKRRAALAKLDTLLQATFLDMFGDPVTNPMGWEVATLQDLTNGPIRNGLSPSRSGTIPGKVLMLSAITRGHFQAQHQKTAMFGKEPSEYQTIDPSDILVCRGNGNIKLVGAGLFPTRRIEDVIFPDTMIAFRLDESRYARSYLEVVWKSQQVRGQIEAGARTTNGTHKVNQTVLKKISFPLPSIDLQLHYQERVDSVHSMGGLMDVALFDNLFHTLQQRAFKGEL